MSVEPGNYCEVLRHAPPTKVVYSIYFYRYIFFKGQECKAPGGWLPYCFGRMQLYIFPALLPIAVR